MTASESAPRQQPSLALLALKVAGQFICLPLALGWWMSPILAEQPAWWDARRWPSVAALAVSGAGATLLGLVLHKPDVSWAMTGPSIAIGLLLWWILLMPTGYALARWRRGLIATAVSENRHDPRRIDRVRRAIWSASLQQAQAVSPTLTYPRHLGAILQDDRRDALTRLRDSRERQRGAHAHWLTPRTRLFTLPDEPRSTVILGGTGSGKTVLLRVLTAAALAAGWRVVFLDGKGNTEDAALLKTLGTAARVPVASWPQHPFDAWRGDGAAVATKAARCLPLDAPSYYRQRSEAALFAVADDSPWRTSEELLQRLAAPANWVHDRTALASLMLKDGRTAVHEAVTSEVRSALRGVQGLVDGGEGSWSWDDEDTRLIVVSLDIGANAAHRVAAGLILADLNAYRQSRRNTDARPLLVIVDEGSVLLDDPQAPDLAVLAEQVRSQGIGLVIAAQSVEGLGHQGARLLGAGGDLLAGRTGDPEAIAHLAGTVKTQEVAHQGTLGGRKPTGVTTAREQATHRLDPDRLREAPTGSFALVERGQPVRWVAIRHHLSRTGST